MEPMDFDCDGEMQSPNYGLISTSSPESSLRGRENPLDFSDMDVEPAIPSNSAVRSSTSLEHISKALWSVVSLNSCEISDCEPSLINDTSVLSHSLVSSQHGQKSQSSGLQSNKTRKPPTNSSSDAVGLRKVKTGYGIPEGETNFAHFPDSTVGGRIRKRLQKPTHPVDNNHRNLVNAQLKVPQENTSNGNSSCFGCTLRIILFIAIAIAVYYIVILYAVHLTEKCKLSRNFNKRNLQIELETNVFGQHLAARIVPNKIEEYFNKFCASSLSEEIIESAAEDLIKCKPLVLSFDGWTGVGKNYISRFISQTFQYSKIMTYVIPLNFPHKSFEDIYRKQIQQWILGNLTQCMVNIIVLDEMDKAFSGVIEGLIEVINSMTQPCFSAGPIIILLLSNTHANDINRTVLKFLLDSPTNNREQLSLEHFSSIFDSELNVWSSKLISEGLIDATVPFLPLEREHVIQCIKRDLVSKRCSTDVVTVKRVLLELSFSSFGNVHLSQTGCKRVADKVDLIMFDKQK